MEKSLRNTIKKLALTKMEEFQVKMSLNDILSQILKIPAPKNQKNGAMLKL